MLKQLQNAFAIAAFVCIVLGFGFVEWKLSSPPPNEPKHEQAAKKSERRDAYYNPFVIFWRWTTHDPVAFYTAVLALLTSILSATAIVQIRFLRKADETARIAANAAQISAEHIPRVERAYLSGSGTARRAVMFTDPTIPATAKMVATFGFDINNFGKTPGELFEIKYGFLAIPTDPNFVAPGPPQYTERLFWQDWYRPGIQSREIPWRVEIPPRFPLIIFGRLYYRDIFGQKHSSGFILRIESSGDTTPIPADPRYTEERDEPN
jgi:hypothetical protein